MLTGTTRIKTKFKHSNYDMYNSGLVKKDLGDLVKTRQFIMEKMKTANPNNDDDQKHMAPTVSNTCYSIKESRKSNISTQEGNYLQNLER